MQFKKILNSITRKSLFVAEILFWVLLCSGFLEAKWRLKHKSLLETKALLRFYQPTEKIQAYSKGIFNGIYFSNNNILTKGRKAGRHYFLVRFQNTSTMSLWCLLHTDCIDWQGRCPSSWIYTPSPLTFPHVLSTSCVLGQRECLWEGKALPHNCLWIHVLLGITKQGFISP